MQKSGTVTDNAQVVTGGAASAQGDASTATRMRFENSTVCPPYFLASVASSVNSDPTVIVITFVHGV